MPSKKPKEKKRRRRAGGREAAAGPSAASREYIDKAPTGGGEGDEAEGADTSGGGSELTLSAVGRRMIAEGFLRWREGDTGEKDWCNDRADKLESCGRPGGPVFATYALFVHLWAVA